MSHFQYIIIALLDVLLGAGILLKDSHRKRNILYFLFSVVLGAWAFSFYVIFHATNTLLAARITVFIGLLIPLTFYYFVKYFLNEKAFLTVYEGLYFIPMLLVLSAALPFDLFVKNVEVVNAIITFETGPAYLLNGIFLLFTILFCLFRLFWKFLSAGALMKYQLSLIFAGAGLALLFGAVFNYVLPLLGHSEFNIYGNFSSVIFLLFFSLAIVKTRFLDVKIIITKTLARILTIALLGAGYMFLSYAYIRFISSAIGIGFLTMTIIYGVVVGEMFHRLRIYFQTTSEKLFFKGEIQL